MKRFTLGGEEIEPAERVAVATNALVLLSRTSAGASKPTPGRLFECKTCNRGFLSFQALGGHRASHKRPRLAGEDCGEGAARGAAAKLPKVHECAVCGLEFAVGQALGGHMRRHRTTATAAGGEGFEYAVVERKPHGRRVFCFDLNLLPSENEMEIRKIVF